MGILSRLLKTQKPPKAQRFEHDISWHDECDGVTTQVDRMSDGGWEMVSATYNPRGTLAIFWKRPVA